MTYTGVNWAALPALKMSTDVYDGPGPGSTHEAAGAWRALSAGLAEAHAEFTSVTQFAMGNWEGPAADSAHVALSPFGDWAAAAGATADRLSAETDFQGEAYSATKAAMPSPAEVVQVEAVKDNPVDKVVGLLTGVPTPGEVAEGVAAAQQAEAAMAMTSYDVTVSMFNSYEPFQPAPRLTAGVISANGASGQAATYGDFGSGAAQLFASTMTAGATYHPTGGDAAGGSGGGAHTAASGGTHATAWGGSATGSADNTAGFPGGGSHSGGAHTAAAAAGLGAGGAGALGAGSLGAGASNTRGFGAGGSAAAEFGAGGSGAGGFGARGFGARGFGAGGSGAAEAGGSGARGSGAGGSRTFAAAEAYSRPAGAPGSAGAPRSAGSAAEAGGARGAGFGPGEGGAVGGSSRAAGLGSAAAGGAQSGSAATAAEGSVRGPLSAGGTSGVGAAGESLGPRGVGGTAGTSAAGARGGSGAGAGTGRGNGQDDDEHDIPDYLKDLEHFTDGRVVAPPVIGADDPS